MNMCPVGGMVGDDNNNNDGLVYHLSNSNAESIIQRTIEGIQRVIKPYAGNDGTDDETTKAVIIEINPAMKRHWESEIKILREAPRDEKLANP
jgi:hypothetical protein